MGPETTTVAVAAAAAAVGAAILTTCVVVIMVVPGPASSGVDGVDDASLEDTVPATTDDTKWCVGVLLSWESTQGSITHSTRWIDAGD